MENIRTLVFLSNFFNHHQKPISDAFFSQLGTGYLFIETSSMSQERKNMGWEINTCPPYVITCEVFARNKDYYQNLIEQADMVIIGAAPNFLIRPRLKKNKLTFRYSERPLKKGFELWKYPYRFFRWRMDGFSNSCVHLLCANAYAAQDFARFSLFQNRSYKWGYFPKTYTYPDLENLIFSKTVNSIIWVARFLELKHPETAVELAKRLKRDGYSFEIAMIGDGQLLNYIADKIKCEHLEDEVHLLGSMKPEEVRAHMEKSEIHIFTSDRKEGWGVVLNESMNSACVPIANVNIGSAPYLINQGKNGFTYSSADELYEQIKLLLDNREIRQQMAREAYSTIITEWNAENAVNKLLGLGRNILFGSKDYPQPETGVCSKAK